MRSKQPRNNSTDNSIEIIYSEMPTARALLPAIHASENIEIVSESNDGIVIKLSGTKVTSDIETKPFRAQRTQEKNSSTKSFVMLIKAIGVTARIIDHTSKKGNSNEIVNISGIILKRKK